MNDQTTDQADAFSGVRRVVRSLLLSAGVDIRLTRSNERQRLTEYHERAVAPWRPLRRYGFRTILDIGGNVGHFAQLIRELVPEARILSFEPLPDCFDTLHGVLQKLGNAEGFHLALGDAPGEVVMHRNEFAPSSSLLPMSELHAAELPQATATRPETVRVARLDDVLAMHELLTPMLAKLDVQGFEDRVLRGGRETIRQASVVVVECSSYVLYEGQPTFRQIDQLMTDLGFIYRGNLDQWHSPQDGRILQFDALYEHQSIDAMQKNGKANS